MRLRSSDFMNRYMHGFFMNFVLVMVKAKALKKKVGPNVDDGSTSM